MEFFRSETVRWALMAAAVAAALLLLVLLFRREHKERAANFPPVIVDGRTPMSGEEFLRLIGAGPAQAKVCLAVREVLASGARIAPDLIYPEDNAGSLMSRWGFLGGDEPEFAAMLGKSLGVQVGMALRQKPGPANNTVGAVGLWLAARIEVE